jgi:acyl CoA:acetate/3-ketoacid CoA transferase
MLIIIYQGGLDAAYLQFLAVSFNGVNLGDIRPENGQTSLPVGTSKTFYVTNLNDNSNHIVVTGHFTGGETEVIMDTTI